MNKLRQHRTAALTALTYFLVYGLVLLLIVSALEYRQKGPAFSEILHLDTVSASVDGGPWETLSLPHTFQELAPQTTVTIRATIRPDYDDCVYLKTVYAPAKLIWTASWPTLWGSRTATRPILQTRPPRSGWQRPTAPGRTWLCRWTSPLPTPGIRWFSSR